MKDKSYFYTEALPGQKAPRTRKAQRKDNRTPIYTDSN